MATHSSILAWMLFNMLSRLVITFLPKSKHLFISAAGGRGAESGHLWCKASPTHPLGRATDTCRGHRGAALAPKGLRTDTPEPGRHS